MADLQIPLLREMYFLNEIDFESLEMNFLIDESLESFKTTVEKVEKVDSFS